MRALRQTILHRPEQGMIGDCHRACLAMILDREVEDIPHFAHDDPPSPVFAEREQEWLGSQGLQKINVLFDGSTELRLVINHVWAMNPGTPAILGCHSRAADHSVVVLDETVYDPSLEESPEITGPMSDGYWWVTYILRRLV